MKYAVLFDRARDGTWGAVVPDLPGCMSAGKTLDEARDSVKEAMRSGWMSHVKEESPFQRRRRSLITLTLFSQ